MEVVGIVSTTRARTWPGASFADIPYHHLPVTRDTKAAQEASIRE